MKKYAIIVIGAEGLLVALGAATAGKRVLFIERDECGYIPSKTLFANARSPIAKRRPEALKKLGVSTLCGAFHFKSSHILEVIDTEGKSHTVKGRTIVLATGSSPHIPLIAGLQGAPYLTNETVFSLKEAPKTVAILGGGPIGCELAQTFSRLGSKVHLIHRHEALLAKEEPRAQELIADIFQKGGITLHFNDTITYVKHEDNRFDLTLSKGELQADALLIACGRQPNISELNLDAAHVRHSASRIPTDRFARTNQKHIFAIGAVRGGPFFTHLAENQARSVLSTLLLPFPKKLDTQPLPRITFTDPEIASCGLSTKQAQQLYPAASLKTYTVDFADLDRALFEDRTEGFISIVTKKWSSKILGVTIAAPYAGEMLTTITLAMQHNIPLRKLSKLIFPYPTWNIAIRTAADLCLPDTFLGVFKKY